MNGLIEAWLALPTWEQWMFITFIIGGIALCVDAEIQHRKDGKREW